MADPIPAAFAFAARAYGWWPRIVEDELTNEQLVALFDADTGFVDEVEAVRTGYALAHDAKAYGSWRRDVDRRSGRTPSGRPLAQLGRDLGLTESGFEVVRGEFEFRN